MGMPASRIGDMGSGHSSCPPTPLIEGSGDTYVNGIPVSRVGDALAPHCNHGRKVASGSPTVFVNGRSLARLGDPIDCGGNLIEGSGDTFVG